MSLNSVFSQAQAGGGTSVDFVEVINQVGFPIAVALAIGWALVWTIKFLLKYITTQTDAWKLVAEKQMERGDRLEHALRENQAQSALTYEQSLLTNKMIGDLTSLSQTRTRARPK